MTSDSNAAWLLGLIFSLEAVSLWSGGRVVTVGGGAMRLSGDGEYCRVRQLVAVLPEQIGVFNAGPVREELLALVDRAATVVIADMTATISCDHAGADALASVYQRAVAQGSELRLVITAPAVRRVLALSGLDRLVSIYPTLAAAVAGSSEPRAGSGPAWSEAITPSLLWRVLEALPDGVLLAGDDGVIVLANTRLEAMFGYDYGELAGQRVEALIPADLRVAHRGYRARYAQARTARLMGAGARPAGLAKDGSTVPAEITLRPVRAGEGQVTLAVIREVTEERWRAELAGLAWAAAADRDSRTAAVLDQVAGDIFKAGLSLQTATGPPGGGAAHQLSEALDHLDHALGAIRGHVFDGRARVRWSGPFLRLPGAPRRVAPAQDRAALLDERVRRTAHALHAAAEQTALLLEERADLVRQPGRADYPAEIKRWRAFAEEIEHMAHQWEHRRQVGEPGRDDHGG